MRVNNFQTPKIQAVLSNFFHVGNDIACSSNRGVGWEGRLNIDYKMELKATKSQRSNLGSWWNLLVYSQHCKLKMEEGVWIQWNGMVEWNVDKLDGFNGPSPPYNDHL